MVYKDLWLSDKCRKDMSEYGITSENLRKLDQQDQNSKNETIDLPRKSMRAIVMLFKYADTVDSEEYIFPKIKKVEISVDGDPNAVYSRGMKTNEDTDMTEEKFYDNKFALVIDLRNNGDNSAMGSGCKVVDTKTGVQLAITKEVTTKDVKCEIFVLSDASVDSVERSFGQLRL